MSTEKGPKKKDTDPLRIAVPARLREYLVFLTRKTTRGASANAVALSVLTEALERMRAMPQYAYEFPEVPTGEDEDGDDDAPATS